MPVDRDAEIAHRILAHYERCARVLPWRNPPGAALPMADLDWPYRVWLSEIMLQQTTVAAVIPYFEKFTARWPSVAALAGADDGEVMSAWAGLGYYARARNMQACARKVSEELGGRFPDTETELLTLPGIGRYTAAAIAAIAFGRRAVVIDGNVERVTARLFAQTDKAMLPPIVDRFTPLRAGDFAQGMMDVGATICTPRSPKCAICPVQFFCEGRRSPEAFPAKAIKAAKPERRGTAWWVERDGQVLLTRRPAKGLLGGMRALPSDDWANPSRKQGQLLGSVTHIFTHFRLTLDVAQAKEACAADGSEEWWPVEAIEEAGLPTVFLKAARLARTKGLNA